MGTGDKVVYLASGRTSSRGVTLLETLASVTAAHLGAGLRAALDEVDDALFGRADRAGSNADQERYFVAMRQVRLHRREIERRFGDGLSRAFAALTAAGAATGEPTSAEALLGLELMDESAVEENVAADTTAGRVRGRHSFALAQLLVRLDHLVAERAIAEDDNPADPGAVVAAFRVALEVLDIEIQPRIILYKLFEKQLLLRYRQLCDELNRTLAEGGVLPALKGTGKSTRPPAGSPARGASAGAAGTSTGFDAGAEGVTTADDTDVLLTLQSLMAQAKGPSDVASHLGGGSPAVAEAGQVVSILSALQQQAAEASAGIAVNPVRLKALINRGLSRSGASGEVGRAMDDTIEIVSMLFEVILNDGRLHGSIKALIARLQIPVLKVALLDRGFFSSRRHPARQLINDLADAALGWNEPEDPAADPLYRKMSAVIEQVIEDFADDVDVFAAARLDFREHLDRERERARVIEERTRQAAEGKARVEDSRERVQTEIQRRLTGWEPPEVVRRLLEEAWFKVLFITAVKEGAEGAAWDRQVEVMDRLIWSVAPKSEASERRRMLAEMPELLQALREGLNGIMFNPFDMTRLFRDLEAQHLRCLAEPPAVAPDAESPAELPGQPGALRREESAPAPPTCLPPSEVLGDATAAGPATEETVDEDDELVQQLRGIDLGTWFELEDAQGHESRAKLSARLNGGRRFIFVNRAGFKVADRPIHTLLEDIRADRAAILDDNTLFDRALESVIGTLRDLRAGQEL